MRNPLPQFRPLLNLLRLAPFALLLSCGGNSSSTDKGTTPTLAEKSLFLVGALALDSADCVANASATATLLAQGVLDLAFTSSYTATLVVGNQLARPGSPTETERVSLRSAEITLTTADGALLEKYSTVGTGFVDAATASAAYGTMRVTVIPAALGQSERVQRAQLLVAKIRVLGEALNGSALTSSELVLPIQVCTGCLVRYPASAADPAQQAGSGYRCEPADATASAPCVQGLDVPFSCALCAETYALCLDPTLNPWLSH